VIIAKIKKKYGLLCFPEMKEFISMWVFGQTEGLILATFWGAALSYLIVVITTSKLFLQKKMRKKKKKIKLILGMGFGNGFYNRGGLKKNE
jgi:hypothetical protein